MLAGLSMQGYGESSIPSAIEGLFQGPAGLTYAMALREMSPPISVDGVELMSENVEVEELIKLMNTSLEDWERIPCASTKETRFHPSQPTVLVTNMISKTLLFHPAKRERSSASTKPPPKAFITSRSTVYAHCPSPAHSSYRIPLPLAMILTTTSSASFIESIFSNQIP